MNNANAPTPERNNARSSVRPYFATTALLERCARAVAEASGYRYTGDSLIHSADTNPHAAQFVHIAAAVLAESHAQEGT